MKKLLSMLAALGMTATAASTVVSCTWGCSPAKGDSKEDGVKDGKVNLNNPKVVSTDEPDGNGYYLGTTKDGKNVSVDEQGHLVDVTGSRTSNPGFGKRIVGFESDGKTPKKDKQGNTIYLDNDGYRIATTDEGKTWHRVDPDDGITELGPDSEPNSGSKSWIPNIDKSTGKQNAKAPYIIKNDGKTIYLDSNGIPVDEDGNPTGQPLPDTINEKYKTVTGNTESDNTYPKIPVDRWTLSGDAEIGLTGETKKGSIVIGDNSDGKGIDNGTAVALNPNDKSSSEWHTIPSGKYAGMKVKIDGGKVSFEWPVDDKQINDVISGETGKDSPLSKSQDGSNKIDLPIEYHSEKDGAGKATSTQKVAISTPWDSKSKADSMKWWLDSSNTSNILKYNSESTTAKVYLSSKLSYALRNIEKNNIFGWKNSSIGIFNLPKFDDEYIDVTIDGYTDPGKDITKVQSSILGALKTDKSKGLDYVQLNIKSKDTSFEKPNNINTKIGLSYEVADGDTKQDVSFIDGAQSAMGTSDSIDLVLSKVEKDIDWNKTNETISDENTVDFAINKVANDLDYNKIKVLIKEKSKDASLKDSSDEGFEDVSKYLKDGEKGINWDATKPENMTLSLTFADGILNKSDYILRTKFDVKDDKENKFGPSVSDIVVTKDSASKSESTVTFESDNVQFNGYQATWNVLGSLGAYVDQTADNAPVLSIKHATSARTFITEDIQPENEKWDGKTLSININGLPSELKGGYTITATFKLVKGFDSKAPKSLSVSQNNEADVDRSAITDATLNFQRTNEVKFALKTKGTAFNAKSIDKNLSHVEFIGGDIPLVEGKDKDFIYDFVDGDVVITLNHEIDYQDKPLEFIVSASDGINAINPEIFNLTKDQAMASASEINWTSASESFNNTDVSFTVKDKSEKTDIDFSSLDKGEIELVATDTNSKDKEYKLDKRLYNVEWDDEKLSIKLNLPGNVLDIKRGSYKFLTIFKLQHGYEKSKAPTTKAELTAVKDVPLEKNTTVEIQQEGNPTLDDGPVVYKIVGNHPEAINLEHNISVNFTNPEFDKAIKYEYDKKDTITVSLIEGMEIKGGTTDISISFGFNDFNDPTTKEPYGYTGDGMVVGFHGTIEKNEPTPGFTEVKVNDAQAHMAADANTAEFKFDKSNPKGVDVDTNTVMQVEQTGIDGKPQYSTAKNNAGEFADGTKYTYDATSGILKVSFSDATMHTTELYTNPRKFKVYFAYGNGYTPEISKTVKDADNMIAGPEMTAQKDAATAFEKNLVATDNSQVRDFYKVENKGTWHVTANAADEIDWNSPDVKIGGWSMSEDKIPLDPKQKIVFGQPSGDGPAPILESHKKDPNLYWHVDVKAAEDGGKDITFSVDNGSLWGDNYTANLKFKLKDYKDEYTDSISLKFSKSKANEDELTVVAAGGDHPKYELVDDKAKYPNLVPKWGGEGFIGAHFAVKMTFKSFGGSVDPIVNPKISIYGTGIAVAGTDPGDINKESSWGADNRWYFNSRGVNDDGSVWFIFETWGVGNAGSYYHGNISNKLPGPLAKQHLYDAQIRVKFAAAGFAGDGGYGTDWTYFHSK